MCVYVYERVRGGGREVLIVEMSILFHQALVLSHLLDKYISLFYANRGQVQILVSSIARQFL